MISVGLNDGVEFERDKMRHVSQDKYQSIVSDIIEFCKAEKIRCIFLQPTPLTEDEVNKDGLLRQFSRNKADREWLANKCKTEKVTCIKIQPENLERFLVPEPEDSK